MFLVRQIQQSDLEATYELSGHLDSFNLPHDRAALEEQIARSVLSFQEPKHPKHLAIYMFVIEDLQRKKVVGTSLVFAKHGTPDNPHNYLKVLTKTHEDTMLNIKREHTLLRYETDVDGPTEIGGLILHPDYRGLPLSLGKHLSFARFMYIAMNLARFEKEVIAELLPPFNEEGSSELWEAYGRRFTGMKYQEADLLSRTDKDFIKNLFPPEDIYTCLFSPKAQAVIGETGTATKPVKHMLEKIGFSYLDAVDPFDGGPHYGAKTKQVTLVKKLKKVSLSDTRIDSIGNSGLVGFYGKRGFSCLMVNFKLDGTKLEISEDTAQILTNEKADLNGLHIIPLN